MFISSTSRFTRKIIAITAIWFIITINFANLSNNYSLIGNRSKQVDIDNNNFENTNGIRNPNSQAIQDAIKLRKISLNEDLCIYNLLVEDDLLYFKDVSRLNIWNITDPYNTTGSLQEIGRSDFFNFGENFYKAGDIIYVIGNFIYILNVSDPTNPQTIGSIDNGGDPSDCHVVGDLLYLADFNNGLEVWNISDPTNSTGSLQKIGQYDFQGSVKNLEIVGELAFVYNESLDGMWILNVSEPDNSTGSFQKLSQFKNLVNPTDIEIVQNIAYVTDRFDGFKIYDIEDPYEPRFIGIFDDYGYSYDVQIKGNYAFVAGNYEEIEILDISKPNFVKKVGEFGADSRTSYTLYNEDSFIYAGGYDGLVIFEIYFEMEPTFGSMFREGTDSNFVQINNGLAYLTGFLDGLKVINISDPTYSAGSVKKIAHFREGESAAEVKIKEGLAYLVMQDGSLDIINVSDPTNSSGTFTTISNFDDGSNIFGVDVVGDFIYAAIWTEGIKIINGSDPTNSSGSFTEIGLINAVGLPYSVQVVDGLAYLPTLNIVPFGGRLEIFNVTDPSNSSGTFKKIGDYNKVDEVFVHTHVSGNLAYISATSNGMRIVNISDPTTPIDVGLFNDTDGGSAQHVQVINNFAYIADYSAGIEIINVSDPSNPLEIADYYDGGNARCLYISNEIAYVADGYDGLEILLLYNDIDGDLLTDKFEYLTSSTSMIWDDTDEDGINDLQEIFHFLTDPNNQDSDYDLIRDGEEIITGFDLYITDPLNNDTDGDNLIDGAEVFTHRTNPLLNDTDNDTISDEEEVYLNLDGFITDPLTNDTDDDGVSDPDEIQLSFTDPCKPDTDIDGLLDGEEIFEYFTDPNLVDTDNDGLTDYIEVKIYYINPNDNDTDDDSLSDYEELFSGLDSYQTDPDDDDSDNDGLLDGSEGLIHNTNPNKADTDNDGLSDYEEVIAGNDGYITNASNADSDGDGLTDGEEINTFFTNPLTQDSDGDGLMDFVEVKTYFTQPNSEDSDNDGIGDLEELTEGSDGYLTNPNSYDTDDDGLWDMFEIQTTFTDPKIDDTDRDGLTDYQEYYEYNTNPLLADSDGDGYTDNVEIAAAKDPLDPLSFPVESWVFWIIGIMSVAILGSVLLYMKAKGILWRKPPINIFISHAVGDNKIYRVEELSNNLEVQKFVNKSFICEEDIRSNIDEWMDETVPLAHILLFVATKNSIKSKDCQHELELAESNNLLVVPLKSDEVSWEELSQLGLDRQFGFEYRSDELESIVINLSNYITDFKSDLDMLLIKFKNEPEISMDDLSKELHLSEKQIRQYALILMKMGKIQGVWSDKDGEIISTNDLKNKIIENLGKFMEILEMKSVNEDDIKKILNLHDKKLKKSKNKSKKL